MSTHAFESSTGPKADTGPSALPCKHDLARYCGGEQVERRRSSCEARAVENCTGAGQAEQCAQYIRGDQALAFDPTEPGQRTDDLKPRRTRRRHGRRTALRRASGRTRTRRAMQCRVQATIRCAPSAARARTRNSPRSRPARQQETIARSFLHLRFESVSDRTRIR